MNVLKKLERLHDDDLFSAYMILVELYDTTDINTVGKLQAVIKKEFDKVCSEEQAQLIIKNHFNEGDSQRIKELKSYGFK